MNIVRSERYSKCGAARPLGTCALLCGRHLIHIGRTRRESHEIIANRIVVLLGLQVIPQRQYKLLQLSNLVFGLRLVLVGGIQLGRGMVLSLLLNEDGLFQRLVFVHDLVVFSLEGIQVGLESGLFGLERCNLGRLRIDDFSEVSVASRWTARGSVGSRSLEGLTCSRK